MRGFGGTTLVVIWSRQTRRSRIRLTPGGFSHIAASSIPAMIKIYRLRVPKDRLRALPTDERTLLLLLGYASNQVVMLRKLLGYSARHNPKGKVEQYASTVQFQMLLRIAVSALFEAWRLIQTRFLANRFAPDYLRRIGKPGQDALEKLKRHFGESGLLPKVRNNFGFHYPKTSDAEAAFQETFADSRFDDIWEFYLSDEHFYNCLYLPSDSIFMHGIAAQLGTRDVIAVQRQLHNELEQVTNNIVYFAHAFFGMIIVEHFSEDVDVDMVSIEGAPKFREITLPFFVEEPRAKSQGSMLPKRGRSRRPVAKQMNRPRSTR
jgi:hypothetical protein